MLKNQLNVIEIGEENQRNIETKRENKLRISQLDEIIKKYLSKEDLF